MAATVVSTAGNATLSVTDASGAATGHLVNGTFALPQPLQVRAQQRRQHRHRVRAAEQTAGTPTTLLTYTGPTAGADRSRSASVRRSARPTSCAPAATQDADVHAVHDARRSSQTDRLTGSNGSAGRQAGAPVLFQEHLMRKLDRCRAARAARSRAVATTRPQTPPADDARPPTADRTRHEHDLDGLLARRQGLLRRAPTSTPTTRPADIEAEYHQPPRPAEAKLGETIELTGTKIGVRFDVTVTDVEAARRGLHGRPSEAEEHRHHGLRTAAGERDDHVPRRQDPTPLDTDASAECSNGFDDILRIDVGRSRSGCLLFPRSGDGMPERFQLALEVVPVEAGGIWNLAAR